MAFKHRVLEDRPKLTMINHTGCSVRAILIACSRKTFSRLSLGLPHQEVAWCLHIPWAPLESWECCVVPERLAWRVDVCACGCASTKKYELKAFKMRLICTDDHTHQVGLCPSLRIWTCKHAYRFSCVCLTMHMFLANVGQSCFGLTSFLRHAWGVEVNDPDYLTNLITHYTTHLHSLLR